MVNKLSWYLKKGFRGAFSAFRKQGCLYFKYLLYLLASLFGKGLIFTYPLFAFADVRIVKEFEETGTFRIENLFEDAEKPKKYWRTVVFLILKLMFLSAGIFLIAIITALFITLGLEVEVYGTYITGFGAIFLLLGIIAVAFFTIIYLLYFAPAIYLLQTNDEMGITDILTKSLSTMKRGKMKLFLINLIHFLIFIAFAAVFFVILFILTETVYADDSVSNEFMIALFVIFTLFLMVFLLPRLILSNKIASLSLVKDLTENE